MLRVIPINRANVHYLVIVSMQMSGFLNFTLSFLTSLIGFHGEYIEPEFFLALYSLLLFHLGWTSLSFLLSCSKILPDGMQFLLRCMQFLLSIATECPIAQYVWVLCICLCLYHQQASLMLSFYYYCHPITRVFFWQFIRGTPINYYSHSQVFTIYKGKRIKYVGKLEWESR